MLCHMRPQRPSARTETRVVSGADASNTPPARLRALWDVCPVGVEVSLGALGKVPHTATVTSGPQSGASALAHRARTAAAAAIPIANASPRCKLGTAAEGSYGGEQGKLSPAGGRNEALPAATNR